jgi:hypothetical protein
MNVAPVSRSRPGAACEMPSITYCTATPPPVSTSSIDSARAARALETNTRVAM